MYCIHLFLIIKNMNLFVNSKGRGKKKYEKKRKKIRKEKDLKFGDGDGPNLCRVKKVDVSSTLIENMLTLVSSNDIITIKIDKKI